MTAFVKSDQNRVLWDLNTVGIDHARELPATGPSEEDAFSMLDLTVIKEALAEVASCMEIWLLERFSRKHAIVFYTHYGPEEPRLWTLLLDFLLHDTDSDDTSGHDTFEFCAS